MRFHHLRYFFLFFYYINIHLLLALYRNDSHMNIHLHTNLNQVCRSPRYISANNAFKSCNLVEGIHTLKYKSFSVTLFALFIFLILTVNLKRTSWDYTCYLKTRSCFKNVNTKYRKPKGDKKYNKTKIIKPKFNKKIKTK